MTTLEVILLCMLPVAFLTGLVFGRWGVRTEPTPLAREHDDELHKAQMRQDGPR